MLTKIAATLAAVLLLSFSAAADPGGKPHHGNGISEDQRGGGSTEDLERVLITAAERGLITAYYQEHSGNRDGDLPPGIRKKLERGKPLPPGIAKKMPDQLATRLPPRPGYAYQVVGPDVLLVQMATGLITDIIRNVVQ
jgi:hypothetical protein